MNNKFINKITIKHYRGIKDKNILELAEFSNITFLVGANNAGKSLISRLFGLLLRIRKTGKSSSENFFEIKDGIISDKDFFDLDIDKHIEVSINFNKDFFINTKNPDLKKILNFEQFNLCYKFLKKDNKYFCCIFVNNDKYDSHVINDNLNLQYNDEFSENVNFIEKSEVQKICIEMHNELIGSILIFDPIRSFDRLNSNPIYVNGSDLIKWIQEQRDSNLLKNAKLFVRKVLEETLNLEAPLHVESDKDNNQLLFTFENQLNLSSNEVGTGYTMLYILLMEMYINKKRIIIIDEIESHLQPGLTRKLIDIVKENSSESQYIIATHSPSVMEGASEGDYLYRFKKVYGACGFESFFRKRDSQENADAKILREVCNELGVIPADALLSNCVIWVEGPSEIFWLRTWLKYYYPIYKKDNKIKANIIEGLHYSILMTGGGLISNLSFSENEFTYDCIEEDNKLNVLRVNPNPFVIIDSDNCGENSGKYNRSLNIANELNSQNKYHPYFKEYTLEKISTGEDMNNIPNFWRLKGREIENYAHPQIIKDFYENISSKAKSTIEIPKNFNNWDVFSSTDGVGELLEKRGVKNVANRKTIKHKIELSHYIFNNFKSDYFDLSKSNPETKANEEMIEDLTKNLRKIIEYIIKVNDLK